MSLPVKDKYFCSASMNELRMEHADMFKKRSANTGSLTTTNELPTNPAADPNVEGSNPAEDQQFVYEKMWGTTSSQYGKFAPPLVTRPLVASGRYPFMKGTKYVTTYGDYGRYVSEYGTSLENPSLNTVNYSAQAETAPPSRQGNAASPALMMSEIPVSPKVVAENPDFLRVEHTENTSTDAVGNPQNGVPQEPEPQVDPERLSRLYQEDNPGHLVGGDPVNPADYRYRPKSRRGDNPFPTSGAAKEYMETCNPRFWSSIENSRT